MQSLPNVSMALLSQASSVEQFCNYLILTINADYIGCVGLLYISVKLVSFVMLNYLFLFKCKDWTVWLFCVPLDFGIVYTCPRPQIHKENLGRYYFMNKISPLRRRCEGKRVRRSTETEIWGKSYCMVVE